MEKRKAIEQLWQECFGDSETFVRFYFDRKYRDEDALLYEQDGKPTAAFLMLPYTIAWKGQSLKSAYISGACTQANARNQGIMGRLLQRGFQEMAKRGTELSFLIPAEEWLYCYYGKSGYTTVFYRQEEVWEDQTGQNEEAGETAIYTHAGEVPLEEIFPYFEKKLAERDCYVCHPREDFQTILGDLFLSGGKLFVIRREHICGMALAVQEEKGCKVKEICYDMPEDKEKLLHAVAVCWKNRRVVFRFFEAEKTKRECHTGWHGLSAYRKHWRSLPSVILQRNLPSKWKTACSPATTVYFTSGKGIVPGQGMLFPKRWTYAN